MSGKVSDRGVSGSLWKLIGPFGYLQSLATVR